MVDSNARITKATDQSDALDLRDLPSASPTPQAARLREVARQLWDVISGDCFGMRPDPWVCHDESHGDGCTTESHQCRRDTEIIAKFLESTVLAERAARLEGSFYDEHGGRTSELLSEQARAVMEQIRARWHVSEFAFGPIYDGIARAVLAERASFCEAHQPPHETCPCCEAVRADDERLAERAACAEIRKHAQAVVNAWRDEDDNISDAVFIELIETLSAALDVRSPAGRTRQEQDDDEKT